MTAPDIEIMLASRDDVADILAIANWAAANTTANFATQPESLESWTQSFDTTHEHYPWFVARHAGRVVGFAKAGPHKPRGAYAWTADTSVYVHHEFHRRGVGRLLYERLIPTMKAQGYVMLLAGITPPNPGSEGLHTKMGFRWCGAFPRAGWKFGRWCDVAYYALELRGEGPPEAIIPVRRVLARD
jgi:phosphinothricin acetyltransferase